MVIRFISLFILLFTISARADFYKGFHKIGTGAITGEVETLGTSKAGLQQTVLTLLLKGPQGENFTIELPEDEVFKVDPSKGNVMDYFPRKYYLGVKHQDSKRNHGGPVDLVMVIPGFGASFKEGAGPYLTELLNRNGYLTVTSHSPAHPDFIRDSSKHGAPGYQTRDAKDLYQQLQETVRVLKAPPYNYEINNVSVVGASLGSMNAALMGKVDRLKMKKGEADAINLHRVFSINPPISNVYGTSAIDTMVAKTVGADKMDFFEQLGAYRAGIRLLLKDFFTNSFDEVAEKSVEAYNSMSTLSTTARQYQFLVGFSFAPTVHDALVPMRDRWLDELVTTEFSDRGYMVVDFFTHYFKRFSVPLSYRGDGMKWPPSAKKKYSFVENKGGVDNDETKCDRSHPTRIVRNDCLALIVTENESLGVVIPEMQKMYDMSYYHLVTWDDDFLLRTPVPGQEDSFLDHYSQDDVQWIRQTLPGGDKGSSIVFENGGGHLGGFYQEEFQQYLLNNLK